MHVPAGLGEKRWNMARRTPRRTIEQRLAALRSFLVEASFPRFGRRNSELIELQRAQLGGDQVGIIADVAEPVRRRDGKARSEEHTSELQSQSNLVCRLLLEKKHNKQAR